MFILSLLFSLKISSNNVDIRRYILQLKFWIDFFFQCLIRCLFFLLCCHTIWSAFQWNYKSRNYTISTIVTQLTFCARQIERMNNWRYMKMCMCIYNDFDWGVQTKRVTKLVQCCIVWHEFRKSNHCIRKHGWKSINSKIIFMLVVTSLQIFDNIIDKPKYSISFSFPLFLFLSLSVFRIEWQWPCIDDKPFILP